MKQNAILYADEKMFFDKNYCVIIDDDVLYQGYLYLVF